MKKHDKILVVSGFPLNIENPNSICVKRMVTSLKEEDVEVDVFDENIFLFKRKKWYKQIISSLLRVLVWPCTIYRSAILCYKRINRILCSKQYDLVIFVHKPFETIYSMIRLRRRYMNTDFLLYELDPISNEIDGYVGFGKHLFWLTKHRELKAYKCADYIVHMRCNEVKYSQQKYSKYAQKTFYSDFPLIENKHFSAKTTSTNHLLALKTIKMLYTGVLKKAYRSPKYLCDVLVALNRNINYEMHFYSDGDCFDIIKNLNCDSLYYHEYVSKDELDRITEESDVLINIGNKYSSMLPSKLLVYIETGKPIIHISNQENDICERYLDKYDLSLILHEKDPVDYSASILLSFLKKNCFSRLSSDDICNSFKENCPTFTSNLIKSILKKTSYGKCFAIKKTK